MATTVRGDKLGTFKRKAFYLVDRVALTVRHGSTGRIISVNDLEYEASDVETLLDLLPENVRYVDGKFQLNTGFAPEPEASPDAMPMPLVITDGADSDGQHDVADVREAITTMQTSSFDSVAFKEGDQPKPVEKLSDCKIKHGASKVLIETHPLSLETLDKLCTLTKEQVGGYLYHLGKGTARSVRKALRNRGRVDLAAAARKNNPNVFSSHD